jgi:putative ABC transport system permease protein
MDSLVLAALGGGLGLVLTVVADRLLIAFGPANIPRLGEVSIDLRVLAFTLVVSAATGAIFGLAPAIHASRPNLQESMKDGGRSVAGSSQNWLRGLLVVSEVTLVFVLLVAAGLMLRSFRRLVDVSPGFDERGVLTARVTIPNRTYPGLTKVSFYDRLLENLGKQNGVQAAAIVRDLPFSGTDPRYGLTIEGRPVDANGGVTFRYRVISADYFKAMGIPLRSGRFFDAHDNREGQAAAIINETAARQNFPNQNPIGQVLLPIGNIAPARCVVVGVVGDVKFGGLDTQPDTEVFFPYAQVPEPVMGPVMGSMAIVLRASGSPQNLAAAIRQQVSAIDRDIPVSSLATMNELQTGSTATRRFQMFLLAVFAGLALALAVVGIYGVTSYWVVHRTQEIGIRMALGASSRDVLYLIVGRGMALAVTGIVLGLAGALALTRLLAGLLYGIAATDPLTFTSVAVLLAATALAACCIPAWRATRVNPVIALRDIE